MTTPGIELLCEERPVYGGRGAIDRPEFDEPGYILQPPCLWGDAQFGLQEPPDVNGVWLHGIQTQTRSCSPLSFTRAPALRPSSHDSPSSSPRRVAS